MKSYWKVTNSARNSALSLLLVAAYRVVLYGPRGSFAVVGDYKNIEFEREKGVRIDQLSESAHVGEMLEKGQISVMMTPHPRKPVLRGSKKIKRLFTDPKAEDVHYYKKNGFFPSMHVVAFKDDVLKKYPEVAQGFFKAFGEAKKICREF
jgi:hypothetical protein